MYGGYVVYPQPINNPPVPSDQKITGGMKLGLIVDIKGSIPPDVSEASVINLKPQIGSDNDIYLHMSIRWNENCIVLKTIRGGVNVSEELRLGDGLPLSNGQNFKMSITVHKNCFKISVNDRPVADYGHRAKFEEITAIGFTGEFKVQLVSFRQDLTVVG